MSHVIYSDIPAPEPLTRVGAAAKYPTANLEIGQSFYEPAREGETLNKALKRVIGSSATVRKKYPQRKFASHITPHPETLDNVIGTWRMADRKKVKPAAV